MKIGFIGVGKLGIPCAEEIVKKGHTVQGYDITNVYSELIDQKESVCEAVTGADIVFVAVPTPHHPDYDGRRPTSHLEPKDFDYSIVNEVLEEADMFMTKDQLLVLISTVLPGTTRREFVPRVTHTRFVYNPYLIAMGTVGWDMINPEMVMIGTDDGSETGDAKQLKEFYQSIMENDPRYVIGTYDECECIKVFYNTFISTKLSLVNMIQDAAMAVGHMNVDVVTDALKYSTDRIMGPKYMTAGLGDGGGCHPRDNIALRSFAERHNFGYDLFDAIMKAREEQANNIAKHFEKIGVSKDMPCVVLGSGFKPGLAHQQEGSPSILVGFYLEKLGYTVTYDEMLDVPAAYMLGWPKYFDDADFARGSIVVDPWRGCNKKEGVTVYHYGDTRNHPLGLVDLYNGRVYEDEDIN